MPLSWFLKFKLKFQMFGLAVFRNDSEKRDRERWCLINVWIKSTDSIINKKGGIK